jgi:hypothetical protein
VLQAEQVLQAWGVLDWLACLIVLEAVELAVAHLPVAEQPVAVPVVEHLGELVMERFQLQENWPVAGSEV